MQLLRVKTILMPSLLGLGLIFSAAAHAIEFRSIAPPKAVLYDAPSAQASKMFILSAGYPVEIIVNLGEWIKVRDQLGGLNWLESKHLSANRTVLAKGKTEIKAAEDAASAALAIVEKEVVLELLSANAKNGWVKVKHRDGITGFVQAAAVWGAN